ncbi:Sterol 3-beta-glucosyltransferase UGT80A2 [Cardamine amara subsp. amara]|uniref:Sterol 3-beta-glucosyltransferase UGT80A2 n=1 Tax=Cardamine amara subsp. amara TaxID=228776 RepID=A0ABD1C415_CARAN
MEEESEKRKAIALFMAFGTKGDVYPLTAIAAAFAHDQQHYSVVLMSHLAHENLSSHLIKAKVSYFPITSPPALSSESQSTQNATDSLRTAFLEEKERIKREHRQECHSAFGSIFGKGSCMEGDFVVINFFALEGWSLAELFQIRCVVAAPYVVPYSPPSGFERQFRKELPDLYKYLKEAPNSKVSWNDVTHWMWPLFTEEWGSWRYEELNLSCYPFADPVTDLPSWHSRQPSPLVLYGFSKEIVECPDYWPLSIRVCGFWFLPNEWQFSCNHCGDNPSAGCLGTDDSHTCSNHTELYTFISSFEPALPIFVGLSSVGSMGFVRNPLAFLRVLQSVIQLTGYRFIIFTAGYEPLDTAIWTIANDSASSEKQLLHAGISIFNGKLFCFSGMVPYNWLFRRCVAAIHHGGSGSIAAALQAGIPQIICPFMLDQFYWAEKMSWLGVSPQPLKRNHLLLDEKNDENNIMEAAQVVAKAIYDALSTETRARAMEIAEILSLEDGVSEAVRVLKEEVCGVLGSNAKLGLA